MTSGVLAVLAVLLSGPVPWALSRSPGLRRAPRSAMLLWQAVALSAVLSALGAGLALATTGGPHRGGVGLREAVTALALVLTVMVSARLALSGHRVGTRVRASRRRHRHLLDVLAPEGAGVRVLEHETPLAYCLPGVTHSRVVVSAGATHRLAATEMEAVLAHERAHLRARHDLVLEAFTVLHEAFPRVVTSAAALAEVRLLVEVLADRAARRRVGVLPLVRALAVLAGSEPPEAMLGAGGPGGGIAARLDLLRDERAHPVVAAAAQLGAVTVLVLPTALVVVPWLSALR